MGDISGVAYTSSTSALVASRWSTACSCMLCLRRWVCGVPTPCRSREAALAAFQEGWAALQVAGASWDAAGPRADVAREADAHISKLRTQKARARPPGLCQLCHS